MRRHATPAPVYMICLCKKAYSPTEAAARQLRREIEGYKRHHDDVRFYECDHGGWHWTRMVDRPNRHTHVLRSA
ncbi:MAG: hypothetical protein QJR09_08055 [Micrococcus sp.]|nr:hypothetical protein [Micrococcus sp.]